MCLNPKYIPNPSKHINRHCGRIGLIVKCQKCAECLQEKQLEWQHRAYAEYIHAEQNGGYTYFETLTYSEENVPWLVGVRCFSRSHIKRFRDNLRKAIVRYKRADGTLPFKGKVNNDNFKFLICSEYGGKTHRPHYHCLFFNSVPQLNVHLLRYFIRKVWTFGLIDRVDTVSSRVLDSTGAISYVTKYIGKDEVFTETMRSHFFDLDVFSKLSLLKKYNSELYYDIIHSQEYEDSLFCSDGNYLDRVVIHFCRDLFPFNCHSLRFGLCAIDQQGRDVLFERGTMRMPDKERIYSDIPIPRYYQNYLFYNLVDDWENLDKNDMPRKRWVLSEYGVEFKLKHLQRSIDKRVDSISESISAISSHAFRSGDSHNQRYVYLQETIHEALNGKSLQDFAEYLLVYKGSVCSSLMLDLDRDSYFGTLLTLDSPILESLPSRRDLIGRWLYYNGDRNVTLTFCDSYFGVFQRVSKLLDDGTKFLNRIKKAEYRRIRDERAALKRVKERHLINPRFINKFNFAV